MKWFLKRFLYSVSDNCTELDPDSENLDKLCEEYEKLLEIHIKNKRSYGDVYTNEEFAKSVEGGYFISYDGIGYYVGTDLMETEEPVDFDADAIRSKADKYPYVFWYNK